MPLTIDNYTAWASQHVGSGQNDAATLMGDRLADIRTTTKGLARFFHTKSFTAQRDAVRRDFQRALSERFGDTVAAFAMRDAGRNLTAASIQQAVSRAQIAVSRGMLTPTGDCDLRLTSGHLLITQQTIGGLDLVGRQAIGKFILASNRSADLLGKIPAGEAEATAFARDVDREIREIAMAKTALLSRFANAPEQLPEADLQRLARSCDELVDALQDHLAHVQDLNRAAPLSDGSLGRFRDVWYQAFTQACNALREKPELADNPKAQQALQDLAQTPKATFDENFEVSKDSGKFLGLVIEDALKTACGKNPLGKGAAKRALGEGYVRVLNSRAWNTITKSFTGSLAGQTFTLTSTITPGGQIEGVGTTYPQGIHGYMCHSAHEDQHAVNLAISSLQVSDGHGETLAAFTGVRHGVHCAWEIPKEATRAAANLRRAQESVKAAFVAYLGRHPTTANGAHVDLPMTSVSLLTPDFARPILAWFKGANTSNEKMMLREQTAAWQALNGKVLEITVNGQTYHVTPKIATFNFGVNSGAVGALSDALGGWNESDKMNREAFKQLRARTQAFVQDDSVPRAKRLAAQTLINQVRDILVNEIERKDSHDAYKAASRIAVLTSLMDGVPCWNCKSGKDRTGEMDVECKFLATLIARGETIPEPGVELTETQKMLFRTIALEGGNLEIQEYNTGIGGFKTGGVSSIPERLGGDDAREFHKGGADFVGV